MVSANFILSKLSPYMATRKVLEEAQSVSDIKKGIVAWHIKYANEYDKIYKYFLGGTVEESAQNVYDFLKENVKYNIESEDNQTLRSPSAIIAPGRTMGADCKNYALFSAGVLDAINRNTKQKIPLAFRFASYDYNSTIPKHVFTVINPGRNEIWVDPVLSYLDEKKQPTYYTDKKIKNMALVALAGTGEKPTPEQIYNGLIAERTGMMQQGRIRKGDRAYNDYTRMINFFADKLGKARVGIVEELIDFGVGVLTKVFAGSNAPNPNDWKGWTPGDVKQWVANDGDSVQNEAVNIVSYINAHGLKDIIDSDAFGRNRVTMAQIVAKVSRGGFPTQAQQIQSMYNQALQTGVINPTDVPGSTTKASISPILIIGLVGAAAVLFMANKK